MSGVSREAFVKPRHGEESSEERRKDVQWYQKEIREDQVHASTREILEKYSGIAPDEVVPHILKIVRVW